MSTKFYRAIVTLIGTCWLASCSGNPSGTPDIAGTSTPEIPSDGLYGAAALLPVLDAQAGPEANVFFSPLSVDYAFGIVALGARGETARELSNILPPPDAPEAYSHDANGVELRLASRLWVERHFKPARSFMSAAEARYHAGMEQIDKKAPEESADAINLWADEATNGLIPRVVGPGDIRAMLAMIITNAIYFDGQWATSFDSSGMEPFLFGSGTDRPFKQMVLRQEFATVDRNGWRAIRLPYRDPRYAMDVLMPEERKVIAAAPSLEFIEEVGARLDKAEPRLVDMKLPQFEVDTDFDLVRPLQSLGLNAPFDVERADLSGMVEGDTRGLFVGGVKQLAKLQVSDTGTRAAAVTVVSIIVTGAGPPDRRRAIDFTVDRPFIVILRDLDNDAILFLGRIADPQAFEPIYIETP